MSEEHKYLLKKYDQLLKKIGRMRYWQQRRDEYYVRSENKVRKEAEREVDKLLAEGVAHIKSVQKEIFQ